jgi:hypothetical protein
MRRQLDHWQQEALELNSKERKARQELDRNGKEHNDMTHVRPVVPFCR